MKARFAGAIADLDEREILRRGSVGVLFGVVALPFAALTLQSDSWVFRRGISGCRGSPAYIGRRADCERGIRSGRFVIAMIGQKARMLRILAFSVVLNVALNLVLIPPFGLVGAAIATVLWNLFIRRAVARRLGADASALVLLRQSGTP